MSELQPADVFTYTTVFLPEPGGGFTIFVPALPEVCGTGTTLREAQESAYEAITLALEVRREMGDSFPEDTNEIPVQLVSVSLPKS